MEHRAERAVVPSGRAEPLALRGEPSTSGASAPGFISVSSSKRDGSTERTRSADALQFGARHRHDEHAGTAFALRQWSCHCGIAGSRTLEPRACAVRAAATVLHSQREHDEELVLSTSAFRRASSEQSKYSENIDRRRAATVFIENGAIDALP